MKLTELEPRWGIGATCIRDGVVLQDPDRHGMAITFQCPHCKKIRLAIWFANPIDGKPPTDNAVNLWQRTGTSFEDLTLTPSIDASHFGHWHGFITNGLIV